MHKEVPIATAVTKAQPGGGITMGSMPTASVGGA